MTHIYYVESNMAHNSNFVVDVPAGSHWLIVITKTPAQFWVEGELKKYPAHCAILYRPLQKIYYRACTDQFINDWIRFETSELYMTEAQLPFGIPFAVHDPDYFRNLFELLSNEHNFNGAYKKSSIDCLLRTLFNKLLESYLCDDITPQSYDLLKLRTAIQNNPGDHWTIAKMADSLKLSPGYLQSIYKKAFGVSCIDDVIDNRIRLAKEYLIHHNQNIAEIAFQCGYQNVEHFSRQFKKVTGTTPRRFQKHARD